MLVEISVPFNLSGEIQDNSGEPVCSSSLEGDMEKSLQDQLDKLEEERQSVLNSPNLTQPVRVKCGE